MRQIEERTLADFAAALAEEERSAATIEKYGRDVRRFAAYVGGGVVSRQAVLAYKQKLG